jgi:hypothetical protein
MSYSRWPKLNVSLTDTPLGNHEDSLVAKPIVVRNTVKEPLTKAVISGRALDIQ